ncbi:ATP-binding protein [uncultured Deinococcus sp.]|uniref:ATP-binding protein n=1 Tax=uncultured Deinococcus sp. TaxID=158789 RepID=UPI0025EA4D3D|nr:ATP-binding protein [uncultured Deinococcus sp.]
MSEPATSAGAPDRPEHDLLAALPDACILLDRAQRVVDLNAPAAALLNVELRAARHQAVWDLLPEWLASPAGPELTHAVQHGQAADVEVHDAARGRRLQVRVFARHDGTGLLCREVTPRSRDGASALLTRHASDLLSVHLPDGRLTYQSLTPAAVAVLGYQADELIGRAAHELIHPDDLRTTTYEALPDQPGARRYTYRIRRKDGTYLWLETTTHALKGPDGAVTGILASSRDVTERQQVGALQRRNESLQAETDALAVFASFTRMVGVESDPLALARHAVETLAQAFVQGSAAYFEPDGDRWRAVAWAGPLTPPAVAYIQAGLPFRHLMPDAEGHAQFFEGWPQTEPELVGLLPDLRAVAVAPLRRGPGTVGLLTAGLTHRPTWSGRDRAMFNAVAQGLSLADERSRLTRELLTQRAELQARTDAMEGFAELARDLAFETDVLAVIRRAQQIVLGMLPPGVALYYEPEDTRWRVKVQVGSLNNETLQRTVDAGLSLEGTGNLWIPWRSGEAYYQEAYAPDTDGLADQTGNIGSTATVPVVVDGRPRGVLAVALFDRRAWSPTDRIILDTAVRHLSLALERAHVAGAMDAQREQLVAANEGLEAFSYSVSHDLRAPLRHIQGFLGILRRAVVAGDAAKVDSALGVVDQAAARMNVLIDALLNFSYVSRNTLARDPVDLTVLVQAVRTELPPSQEHRIQWTVEALPTVRGDATLLGQVMGNLIHNAVKYSGTRPHPAVTVRAERQPGADVIVVSDNGVGFDPQYQHKLFGVFQRLHRQDEFEGTGIGLATVRRIIQRHGGQVWATSVPGEGATFSFSLPREEPALSRPPRE